MKLLVDDFGGGLTGIGRYYREIIDRFPKKDLELITVKRNEQSLTFYTFFLGRKVKKYQPQIFWSPGFIPPFYKSIPYIVTVHDLMHLKFYSRLHKFYYNTILKSLLERDSTFTIVTSSINSKNDLLRWLNINPEKIQVVYPGISTIFFQPGDAFKSWYPYFLYVGNRRVNKNLERMLIAFSHLKDPVHFILTGNVDKQLAYLIQKVGISNRVHFVGSVDEETLRSLYHGSVASVYVSLYEGFGFPNVEALACGANIVTSRVASIPEVVGDQGILVDPYSIDEISVGLRQALDMFFDIQNDAIIGSRKAFAERYSWDKAASTVWSLIKEAVSINK